MNRSEGAGRYLLPATILLAAAAFALDVVLPLGSAGGVAYVAVVLLFASFQQRWSLYVPAAACTALTILGFYLSAHVAEGWQLIASRLLAVFAIWIAAMSFARRERIAASPDREHEEHGRQAERGTTAAARARLQKASGDCPQAGQAPRAEWGELAHLARLNTMGQMACSIAHELNQPLAAIINYTQGCVQRLRSGGSSGDGLSEALERASGEALRAGKIIRRLRDFARHRGPERSAGDINEIIGEITGLLEADARYHGVSIRLALGEALPPVLVDRIGIQQVLVNLVRNGIEAMADESLPDHAVTIETSLARGQAVEVAVRDTGPGLDPESRERIFDPLFTTKSEGLGLGLAISRSIVEAHGGRLWAAPGSDRGATFRFTPPVACGVDQHEIRSNRICG